MSMGISAEGLFPDAANPAQEPIDFAGDVGCLQYFARFLAQVPCWLTGCGINPEFVSLNANAPSPCNRGIAADGGKVDVSPSHTENSVERVSPGVSNSVSPGDLAVYKEKQLRPSPQESFID